MIYEYEESYSGKSRLTWMFLEKSVKDFQDIVLRESDLFFSRKLGNSSTNLSIFQNNRVRYLWETYREICRFIARLGFMAKPMLIPKTNISVLEIFIAKNESFVFIGDMLSHITPDYNIIGQRTTVQDSGLAVPLETFKQWIEEFESEYLDNEKPPSLADEKAVRLLPMYEVLERKEELPIAKCVSNPDTLESIIKDWLDNDIYVLEKEGKLCIVEARFDV